MYVFRVQYNWQQKAGSGPMGAVPSYYNLFYFPTPVDIINGEMTIRTKPNACVLSAPGYYRGFCFSEDTTMHWFHAEKEIKELIDQYQVPLNCVFYPENPGFVAELFRKIQKEFYQSNPYREELIDGYTRELLIKLSRSIHGSVSGHSISSNEQKKLQQLRLEMLSHPDRVWTVEEMAHTVSLSPSRFHAVYKQLFGSSPMKDVIDAKVELAKTLLLMEEDLTLRDVTERLGYKNQQHFIRQFKAATGLTPGAYKKGIR